MPFDHVRKLVSGGKARFVDVEAAVNLDLVYVTDRVIIMGYPATGFESLYRNRRRDVLRFIHARHGDKWWVWNLCPVYENAYSPESMHGRVSRYPFADHHPPPLPLLPLAVREMRTWLDGDSERVAIIHCKAGKGRSGTLLCSYLLSLPALPPPPEQDRAYTDKERLERARVQAGKTVPQEERDGWVLVGEGSDVAEVSAGGNEFSLDRTATPELSARPQSAGSTSSSTTTISRPSPPPSAKIRVISHGSEGYTPIDVGDEGDERGEGQRDRRDGRVDAVFKLHSSRRMKPTSTGRGVSIPSQRRWVRYVHLVYAGQAPPSYLSPSPTSIRLLSVTLLLRPATGWKRPVASLVLGGSGTGEGKAWASVARYDDGYVDELRRRAELPDGAGQGGLVDDQWDRRKMFRACGKLEPAELDDAARAALPPNADSRVVHHLVPGSPLVLDRGREFRLKLHLGALPLGWAWMIPAFHLPEPAQTAGAQTHALYLERGQIDFALGPGAAIDTVVVRFEDAGGAEAVRGLMGDAEEAAQGVQGDDDEQGRGGERVHED